MWSVSVGLRIAQGFGVAVLLGAGFLTARLAGETVFQELIYVIALPGVGLLIVALEVAAHEVQRLERGQGRSVSTFHHRWDGYETEK